MTHRASLNEHGRQLRRAIEEAKLERAELKLLRGGPRELDLNVLRRFP